MPGVPTRFICGAMLFDLDGVLVDSTRCIEHAWCLWAERHGLDAARILRTAHGRRAVETVGLVAPHLDAAAELATLTEYETESGMSLREIAGVRELIAGLPAGRWAVVTSGVRAVAERRLRFARIPIPGVMVCADDVAAGKPDPEGYRRAAQALGVAPRECIVVEDAPLGIEAARAAGMRVLAVTTTHEPGSLRDATVVVSDLGAVAVHVGMRPGDPTLTITVTCRVAPLADDGAMHEL